MQIELKILGGLPVKIECKVLPAEPENGLFNPFIEEWKIVEIAGRLYKEEPFWIFKRIENTDGELDRIETELYKELGKCLKF